MKICKLCEEPKEIIEFYKIGRGNKLRPKCKTCEQLSPERQSWKMMIQRVTNPNVAKAEYYCGKVQVCERWKVFENFLEDILSVIGPRPKGKSLDRIDNDGNYVPGNVKWSTASEQNINKRKRKGTSSKYHGLTWDPANSKWQVRANNKHLCRVDGEVVGAKIYNQYIVDNQLKLPLNVFKENDEGLQIPNSCLDGNPV